MADEIGNESPALDPGPESSGNTGKNIFICLDGTGNQYGKDLSNVVKLYRMIDRVQESQIAYYDPGVGTMDDRFTTPWLLQKISKALGLGFGKGLMKNLIEAYTYLMLHYESGDRIYLFGFSRGAYTARALAAFIRQCGLFEPGAENLIPDALKLFLKKNPTTRDFKLLSGFRSTYGRQFKKVDDPKYPNLKLKKRENPYHWQLRIHFLGLFDTVKSYGWVSNPVMVPDESKNPSVLHVRHALAIDERRIFFRQLHWISSPNQDCKEVWFPGVLSDVGGGYPEKESGLSKVSLEWMVHEACTLGMKVDPYRYGLSMRRIQNGEGAWINRSESSTHYSSPVATSVAHESLAGMGWHALQLLHKPLQHWENNKHRRTIKSEVDRPQSTQSDDVPLRQGHNPLLIHSSVLDRMYASEVVTITTARSFNKYSKAKYRPINLFESIPNMDSLELSDDFVEPTLPTVKP
jgi:uncharacterized protein (DUF2235 family)